MKEVWQWTVRWKCQTAEWCKRQFTWWMEQTFWVQVFSFIFGGFVLCLTLIFLRYILYNTESFINEWFGTVVLAISGLLGVILGSRITSRESRRLEEQRRERNARYLAIRILCQLDQYVLLCGDVARDDGRLSRTFGRSFKKKFDKDISISSLSEDDFLRCMGVPLDSSTPKLDYPSDVDWSSIDHDLAYRILSLPNIVKNISPSILIEFVIEADFNPAPTYERGYEERQLQYSKIGLLVHGITEDLRGKYSIPKHHSINDQDDDAPEVVFQKKINGIEKKRRERDNKIS